MIGATHEQGGHAMLNAEPGFETFDLKAIGVGGQRLDFVQRQRIAAFLADSAFYLGLARGAAQGWSHHSAPPVEQAQLTAGVAGC